MSPSQEGHALTIGGQQPARLTFPDPKTEGRIRAGLKTGRTTSVRIAPAERSDVEGHVLDSQSVLVNLQLEGDDTEGHAINVHFPTAADADNFRRNVLAAGLLAGTIVLGSAGAIAITSNLSPSSAPSDTRAPVTQSQYMAPGAQSYDIATGINPATGQPWRTGFQERSDGEVSVPGGAAVDSNTTGPAVTHPAGTVGGPLEGNE
jgi:hypothetical protein